MRDETDLHDIIIDILNDAGRPISVKEIWQIINDKDLWRRPKDGELPKVEQISARVSNYPHLFLRKNGVVSLIEKQIERRLFRLTWNTKGWEYPSGHKWKKENQGNTNIAHEHQYGFGAEEWLFDPRFQQNGYQYGYIRGVMDVNESIEIINEAYLFTIEDSTKDRYLVGIINDLEIIEGYPEGESIAKKLFLKNYEEMREDLKSVNADLSGFKKDEFISCVRFKINNQLFEKPILLPGLRGRKYNRFIPYKLDADLSNILRGALPEDKFIFNGGISKNKKNIERHNTSSVKSITRIHGEITDQLVRYLSPNYSVEKNNISVEKTKFGENIADIVLEHSENEVTIIEVKTSSNVRRNIREALGQLLDYALWFNELRTKELIIVAPSILESNELNLLKRIQENLKIKVSYWRYIMNANNDKEYFEQII